MNFSPLSFCCKVSQLTYPTFCIDLCLYELFFCCTLETMYLIVLLKFLCNTHLTMSMIVLFFTIFTDLYFHCS